MSQLSQTQRYLIFDESGNLGNNGRYFVIACIDTVSPKQLHNIIYRKLGIAKERFPELSALHSNEVKAKDAYPCIRQHILECIASKGTGISYIVADLKHVRPDLLKEKNILYNFLMRLLIERLVTESDNGSQIHIICDNHTTKVTSANSFSDYIKLFFLYEKEYRLNVQVTYMDSNSKNACIVQAADYVANALYSYYEYGNRQYFDVLHNRFRAALLFPFKTFGR